MAFSAGGDGGGKAPEHPALHIVCGGQRLLRHVLIDVQVAGIALGVQERFAFVVD